jgi:hypothetical protein
MPTVENEPMGDEMSPPFDIVPAKPLRMPTCPTHRFSPWSSDIVDWSRKKSGYKGLPSLYFFFGKKKSHLCFQKKKKKIFGKHEKVL